MRHVGGYGAGGDVEVCPHDAFGATRTHTGTSANVWKFTGEQNDVTVNQSPYYLRARYYDPVIGRFFTRDPFTGFAAVYACSQETNCKFLMDFVAGTGETTRVYEEGQELRDMQNSAGAQKIRDAFVANNCRTTTGINYDTTEAFFQETLLHPFSTAAQVGGFANASATKEGNGMMRIHIENDAGLHSFLYHLFFVPDRSSALFRTIHQVFDWEEPVPGECLTCHE